MSSLSNDPSAPPPFSHPTTFPRLSLPWKRRLQTTSAVAFAAGALLGLSHGSQMTGLRFRAENAHRLPQSPSGWYLYHKSKNYHMLVGGTKEGLKMGAKLGAWAAIFFTLEEAVDISRGGRKDFLSTVVAGLSVAGAFSAWNRFPMVTAARTAKQGLAFGLVYGLAQDAISLAKGRRLAYVDFILGKNRRPNTKLKQMSQQTIEP